MLLILFVAHYSSQLQPFSSLFKALFENPLAETLFRSFPRLFSGSFLPLSGFLLLRLRNPAAASTFTGIFTTGRAKVDIILQEDKHSYSTEMVF